MNTMTRMLKGRKLTGLNRITSRGRDDWDSVKTFPFDNPEYNIEPKQDEFVREVFEKHYYHFTDHASIADSHHEKNAFSKYREWQHLYSNPE
jgi:hypothetical protein